MINKTLLWKEWNSNRSILLFLAGILFIYPISLIVGMPGIVNRLQDGETLYAVAMGITLGLTILGQERKYNTMDFLLSLPFGRKRIFTNKMLFAMGGIIFVNLVSYLCLLAIWFGNSDIQSVLSINSLHTFLYLQIVAGLFSFAFCLLFSTLAGSLVAAGIFTIIFSIFPAGFVALVMSNAITFSSNFFQINWGTVLDWGTKLSPVDAIMSYNIPMRWPWILTATLVLVGVSYWLFLRNPMEKNGEILVFPSLYPILKIGVSICTALLAGAIATMGGSVWQIVFFILGGVGGWLFTAYLIRRSQNQV